MKFSKRILKAVNEGVYRALADLDDDEDIVLFRSDIDLSKSDRKYNELKFINDNFVDLNLPSGTLWAPYNIGATCKDSAETWYGNYYAWGETEPKEEYFSYSYKGSSNIEQHKLLPSDDIATKIYNNNCVHLPTVAQIDELFEYTFTKYITNYNGISQLDGMTFSSLKDPSKFIFIPCTGINTGTYTSYINITGELWSCEKIKDIKLKAYCLYISQYRHHCDEEYCRSGIPARGIYEPTFK